MTVYKSASISNGDAETPLHCAICCSILLVIVPTGSPSYSNQGPK
eukprot:CAMPEP_0172487442 /NCGR_PEP_ID=MMETSP1066-20121228/16547_1 /TAXON_ID=671091 /ORGANISM="Coscinodiscus wailesii, Strain CCMP2513" /LENGTH=44 /DNA_ID= /DNA_START= /DNA_END= /DNA_ORIENTATION=